MYTVSQYTVRGEIEVYFKFHFSVSLCVVVMIIQLFENKLCILIFISPHHIRLVEGTSQHYCVNLCLWTHLTVLTRKFIGQLHERPYSDLHHNRQSLLKF